MLLWSLLALVNAEFETVTSGSSIKLQHSSTGFRLHSHDINYGGGSGQQSVTANSAANDNNSYYYVTGTDQKPMSRGTPIKCGSQVFLVHATTSKKLHSHLIQSPLSNQQEVSAHNEPDSGDVWILGCVSKSKVWKRGEQITLKHKDTNRYLSASPNYQFGRPINGQLEVCAKDGVSHLEKWQTAEGIYISEDDDSDIKTEL
jgi:dolichyl-phosphate-mannose--protein O-mannosyl transferase